MRSLIFGFQLLVSTLVAALVAHHYYDGGAGFAFMQSLPFEDYIYYGVAGAVALIPVFWALTHLFGGMFFGMAAGGFVDGVKLGLILGIGMAVARCWMYVLGAAIGVYAGEGPMLYVIGGIALSGMLFALDKFLVYFWQTTGAGKSAV